MARKVFIDLTLEQARLMRALAADRSSLADPAYKARIEAIERVLARALKRFDAKGDAESPPGDR